MSSPPTRATTIVFFAVLLNTRMRIAAVRIAATTTTDDKDSQRHFSNKDAEESTFLVIISIESSKKRIALNLCSVVFQSSSVVHCFPFISSSFYISLLPLIIIVINVILIIRLSHFTGMPFTLIVFIIIIA